MNDKKAQLSLEELLNQSEVKDFLFRAEREMLPKMQASAISLIIGSDMPDIKLALEVGAAILFDKPLLLVVPPGRTISATLRKIATLILDDFDYSAPDQMDRLQQAIAMVMKTKQP